AEILVDMAAQSEASLHRWIEGGDVLGLASELDSEVFFWHVMDDGKDSVALLKRLFERYGDAGRYVIVLNYGRGSDFSMFKKSDVYRQVQRLNIPVVELRALHGPTMLRIDRFDKSFWGAVNNNDTDDSLGLMERQRVKVWTRQAFGAFERLGL
ncbi:MAG: mobilization protein, partial [Myxococcota bacterium]